MSRRENREARIDLWLTMGSPLGGSYVKKHLLGGGETGGRRFPSNLNDWRNIAAVGELTAFRRRLRCMCSQHEAHQDRGR